MSSRFIHRLILIASKKTLLNELGKAGFAEFKRESGKELQKISKDAPSIRGSIYASNYQFCLCYIAWYKALSGLDFDKNHIVRLIWNMNEDFIHMFPPWILKSLTGLFLAGEMKRAQKHEKLSEEGRVPEFGWKLRFKKLSREAFEIDIYECGMLKLAERYGANDLFPGICRMDYLTAHYRGHGFVRTKTLADGDDCCDCLFIAGGNCEWAPEKGFADRK